MKQNFKNLTLGTLLIFGVLKVNFIFSQNNNPPLLGLHGTSDLSYIDTLNAKCARFGFTDYQIKNAINNGGAQSLSKIIQLDSAGIEVITYLLWPEDTVNHIGLDYERIPVNDDRDTVFAYLDKYLTAVGQYIDWIQISQEPLGITKYNDTIYTITEILDWWRTVAIFIREKQAQDTLLSHIKLMTGGITGIKGQIDRTGSPAIAAIIDSIIWFGEDHCDAIDIHLHTSSVSLGTQEISYISARTNSLLTCTEWSQSYAAVETNWLTTINATYGITNRNVIDSAYINQMTPSDWYNFILGSPFTLNFIPDFYNVMNNNCFIHACYAMATQYGSPRFDWVQLIATKTTLPISANQPFFDEYVNLANDIETGIIGDSCTITNLNYPQNENTLYKVYPNPTNGKITIEAGGIERIELIDMQGRTVYMSDVRCNICDIDINNNSKGVYFVKVITNKGVAIKTIVLE